MVHPAHPLATALVYRILYFLGRRVIHGIFYGWKADGRRADGQTEVLWKYNVSSSKPIKILAL